MLIPEHAIANNPLEKNRLRVGVIPKFGNRQYVPGSQKATVIWYDNKNNPEETDVSMLKPLSTTVAQEERQKQNLAEEVEWDKYKANDVDVNPETHEETKKTNDDRMSNALTGLQASFRKMLEEIDQVVKDLEKESKALKHELYKMSWFMRGALSIEQAFMLDIQDREIISNIIHENLEVTKDTKLPFF